MDSEKKEIKSTVKFIVLIVFIVSAFVIARFSNIGELLNDHDLRQTIEDFGVLAPIIFMLIYAVAPSLMLPGLPITVLGGLLFGAMGIVYTSIGATIGATIAFLIARNLGREKTQAIISKYPKLSTLDEEVNIKGWKIVMITRLIPLFPFNLLNYAFGLTSIKLSHYAAASFVFMLPGISAYVLFSSSLLDILKGNISKEFVIGVTLLILVTVIPIIYKKIKNKN